jgi:hypothetical protein
MVGSGHIRTDPGHFGLISGRIRPYPARASRIPAILAISGRLGLKPAGIWWPESDADHRIPAPAEYQRLDVVELRCRLDSDDQQLLNSDNRISNMRVRTKSLISKNDLQF